MTTASTLTISSATSPAEVRTWGDLAWAIAEFGPSAVESNLIAAAAFAQDRDPMLARHGRLRGPDARWRLIRTPGINPGIPPPADTRNG